MDNQSDGRILRRRQRELDAFIDRRQAPQGSGTPRFLGQVYNNGNMGSQPNLVYLTHPVEVDVGDAEGDTPSYNVDTTRSVPVIVLNGSPQVGDILPSFGISGRWVAEVGGCGCTAWFCNSTYYHTCIGGATPASIIVTLPIYGAFTLPRVQGSSAFDGDPAAGCAYKLATTVNYPGSGTCPPVNNVPVCMWIGDSGVVPKQPEFHIAWQVESTTSGMNCGGIGFGPGPGFVRCPAADRGNPQSPCWDTASTLANRGFTTSYATFPLKCTEPPWFANDTATFCPNGDTRTPCTSFDGGPADAFAFFGGSCKGVNPENAVTVLIALREGPVVSVPFRCLPTCDCYWPCDVDNHVSVQFSGGGGTGASAYVSIFNGKVECITLVSVGHGYTSNPTVTIANPATGTDVATATAGINAGSVSCLFLGHAGSGYGQFQFRPETLVCTIACAVGTYGPFTLTNPAPIGATLPGTPALCCAYGYRGTVDFPGTDLCPAVPNVPITLTYNPCTGFLGLTIGCAPGTWSCPEDGTGGPFGPGVPGLSAESLDACPGAGLCSNGNGADGTEGLFVATLGVGATCGPYVATRTFNQLWAGLFPPGGFTIPTFFGGKCNGSLGNPPSTTITVTVTEP